MGNRRMVTALDVARAAGVSRSAVSRTFTEGASVSEKTRRTVMEAAWSLGYRPNAIARSLITQRSRMIGVVMAEIGNPFYTSVLEAFSEKLQAMDMRVLLFTIARAHDIDDALPALLQYQVDGVVITSSVLSSEMARKCDAAGMPVVLFNRDVRAGSTSSVSSDNRSAGRMVADYLLDGGHRRPGFVAGTEDTSTSINRERGFVERLAERGVGPPLRDCGDYTYDGGAAAARRLLTAADRPDALFCANDVMAMGALDVARRELGLDVPADLSLVGFDGIEIAGLPPYDITTVFQRIDPMTDIAIDVLMERIDDPSLRPVKRLVPCELRERGSARRPKPA